MELPSTYHWEWMKEVNPGQFEKYNDFGAMSNPGEIPAKYRELIFCAIAYALHCKPATINHTMNAMDKYGCTKEEIHSVLSQIMMMAGASAYRDAVLNLEDYLKTK